jgi:hypothetical protein
MSHQGSVFNHLPSQQRGGGQHIQRCCHGHNAVCNRETKTDLLSIHRVPKGFAENDGGDMRRGQETVVVCALSVQVADSQTAYHQLKWLL